jgi:hypothetical protein
MTLSLIKKPSAWLPVAMSLAALLLLLQHVIVVGVTPDSIASDEGAPARLWQLLMAGQLPLMIYFAVRWLPRLPGHALRVLGLQAIVAFSSFVALLIAESFA